MQTPLTIYGLAVSLFLTLILTSCPAAADLSSSTKVDKGHLQASNWVLSSYEIDGQKHPGSGDAQLRFEGEGSLSGNSGCNTLGGDYKLMGSRLYIGPMMMTKRFCQDMAQQESALTRILGDTVDAVIDNDQLRLTNKLGTLIYEAESSQSQTDVNKQDDFDYDLLSDKHWSLKRYETDGNMQTATGEGYLTFQEDMVIGGSTACNTFGGDVSIGGQHLILEDIFSTQMYCEAYSQQEQAVFDILRDSLEIKLQNGQLHLRNSHGTLIFEPEEKRLSQSAERAAPSTYDNAGSTQAQEMLGLFVYMADAAGFTPCSGSESYPVAMEKGYLASERAYTNMEKLGAPALARVRAYTKPNPSKEGKRTLIVIEELIEMTAASECP